MKNEERRIKIFVNYLSFHLLFSIFFLQKQKTGITFAHANKW